jgi:hypothetical protein
MSQPLYRHNIVNCLDKTSTVNTKLNAMTTLMQLITADNYTSKFCRRACIVEYLDLEAFVLVILTPELQEYLKEIKANTQQTQASTMAALFLVDYYHYSN